MNGLDKNRCETDHVSAKEIPMGLLHEQVPGGKAQHHFRHLLEVLQQHMRAGLQSNDRDETQHGGIISSNDSPPIKLNRGEKQEEVSYA
mmetsp:Transcript_43460/g.104992  ORF Transcript_43460/g.104992 Transcript_43460/m.104992 type:complete len:89 (-) Transcript_43460:118-384(-)